MLTNRIVRALVGVVFAKAAVATGWYLYQKQQKESNLDDKEVKKDSDDLNALEKTPVVHDLTPAIKQVEDYQKAKEDLKNATNMKEAQKAQDVIDRMKVTVYENGKEVSESKPKRVRKLRVVEKEPVVETVADEAKEVVKEKATRKPRSTAKKEATDKPVAKKAAIKTARKTTKVQPKTEA